MKKFLMFLAFLMAANLSATDKLVFDNYGFSIDKLQIGKQTEGYQAVVMYMPLNTYEFTPNVNVLVQKFDGTPKDYADITRAQLEEGAGLLANGKIIKEEQTDTTYIVEYTATLNGMNMHFYSKSIFNNGLVYLATGTSLVSQWNKAGTALKNNVNSFEVFGK